MPCFSWLLSAQTAPVSALDEFGFEIQADAHACTQRVVHTQLLTAALRPHQGARHCQDGSCSRVFRVRPVGRADMVYGRNAVRPTSGIRWKAGCNGTCLLLMEIHTDGGQGIVQCPWLQYCP